MIHPEDIRRKAANLYGEFLRAWLDGQEDFFPRVIPARKTPDADDLAGAIQSMRQLREASKEVAGFGYTVRWQEVNSRKLGRNQFPAQILFETREDYLRFLGKQQEFKAFADAADHLRTTFPALVSWARSHVQRLVEVGPEVSGLVEVCQFLHDHPRPNLFARELPVAVDTKFIERHEGLLREWLDIVLPPHTIRADEDHFARRYGLRYAEPHLWVRLLDPQLKQELGFPCLELSIPLHSLGEMTVRAEAVFVVENKVNLLTLPPCCRGIGLGGLGKAATLLRYLPWLSSSPIVYWGDLDVEGFEILSSVRSIFAQTKSVFMDGVTLDRWRQLATPGTGHRPDLPPHLTGPEQAAFVRCRDENIRLEQERLPQSEVVALLQNSSETKDEERTTIPTTQCCK